jgi:hypothetical protein
MGIMAAARRTTRREGSHPRTFQWLGGAGFHACAPFGLSSVAIHVQQQLLFQSNPALFELFCPRIDVGSRRIPQSPWILDYPAILMAQGVKIWVALAEAFNRLSTLREALLSVLSHGLLIKVSALLRMITLTWIKAVTHGEGKLLDRIGIEVVRRAR